MVDKHTGIWSFADATRAWDGTGHGHGSCQSLKPMLEKYLDKESCIIDMGCGLGDYINYLNLVGFEVYGCDGTPNIDKCSIYHPVHEADLTQSLDTQVTFPKGNVISLEVGEHIPKEHEHMFIKNITEYCNDTLILSWALPGQGGHGHYNEQPNEYVIQKIEAQGLKFDAPSTLKFRNELQELMMDHRPDNSWGFFLRTLMIFRRN